MMILDLERLKLFEPFLKEIMSDSLIEKSREIDAE